MGEKDNKPVEYWFKIASPPVIEPGSDSNKPDMVNNPPHYRAGKIEVIDCIESMIAAIRDPEQAFLAGQVLKYIARYPLKNGVEDLKKSRWYLDRLIGKVEQ